jgi:hypothetical protein
MSHPDWALWLQLMYGELARRLGTLDVPLRRTRKPR